MAYRQELPVDKLISLIQEKGYFNFPNFIPEKEIDQINIFFDLKKEEFLPAKIGKGPESKREENIRGDYSFWIDPLDPPAPLQKCMLILEELKEHLNKGLFLGLKQYECHLALYPKGSFYKKHLDKFQSKSSRVFTFIFYLNQNWHSGLGGELLIYDKNQNLLERIEPRAGSFVGFLSEDFPHEVLAAKEERRSFTGWIHSKIIY